MEFDIKEINGTLVAEVLSDEIVIAETQDALDLMADAYYHDARNIIIREENINPEFFDLKTRLAGDILQKFSNYDVQLAIVGDFSKYESKSLRDFMYESNKHGRINFVGSMEEAMKRLAG